MNIPVPPHVLKFPTKEEFSTSLTEFMRLRGTPLPARLPQLGHKEIDLYKLYYEVVSRGGLEEVVQKKGWKDIIHTFSFPGTCTNAGYNLRCHYLKFLYAFERKFYRGLPDEITAMELDPASAFKKGSTAFIHLEKEPTPTPKEQLVEKLTSMQAAHSSAAVVPKLPTNANAAFVPAPSFTNVHVTELNRGNSVSFKSANYARTPIPTLSNRQKAASSGELHLQQRIALCLNSAVESEITWALSTLLTRSFDVDIVIKPAYGLIDILLKHLQKHWDQVASLIAEDSQVEATMEWMDSKNSSLEAIQQLFVIFNNLSCVPENEKFLGSHQQFVSYILEVLWCKDDVLATSALQVIRNLGSSFTLTEANVKCLAYIFGFLYNESLVTISIAIGAFARFAESPENQYFLSRMDISFFKRLEELLFTGDDEDGIRENTITFIHHFVHIGTMRTKIFIAQQTNMVRLLATLLSFYCSQLTDDKKPLMPVNNSFATKIATILYNLATEPKNSHLFISYEEFFVSITLNPNANPQLVKVVADILIELAARY